ncbi:MAG: MarR family winged helix-turn-helix transcriptional regulator [Pseudomonadales bacterium]
MASVAKKHAAADEPGLGHQEMLLRKLLHAFYWVDDGLQAHMVRETGISLPRAQSMMMACIDDGITRQADMAKQLRVSKQAVQQALKALIGKGFVQVDPDPDNGRQKIVSLTRKGREMRQIAREGIRELERALAERIGSTRLEALHEALDADWGSSGRTD